MPYNGSGTWVPPAGQPVSPGTVISSSVFNTLVTDVGNTFNNALPRDGQGTVTAPLKILDGSSAAPGLTFNSESSSGLWRPGANMLSLSVTSVEVMRLKSNGAVLIKTTTDNGTSALQVNGDVLATSFTGAVVGHASLDLPLTGGTLTGALTGTSASFPSGVTANVTGNVTGALSGNVTGNVTGNVSGNLTGNVTGNLTGTVTGHSTLDLALTGGILSGGVIVAQATTTSYVTALSLEGNGSLTGQRSPSISFSANNVNAGIWSERYTSYGGDLVFGTQAVGSSASPLEKMRLTSAGYVGIGTAAPAAPLHVSAGTSTTLRLGGVGASDWMHLGNDATGAYLYTPGATSLRFLPNNILAATFDTAGRLGIGTGTSSINALLNLRTDSGDGPMLMLENRAVNASVHKFGSLVFSPYRDVADPVYGAAVWAEGGSAAGYTADLVFGTSLNNAAATFPSERMRIDSAGALHMATGNPIYAANYGLGTNATTDAGTFGIFNGNGPAISMYGSAAGGSPNVMVFYRSGSTESARFDTSGNFNLAIASGGLRMNSAITRFESAEQFFAAAMTLSVAHGGPRKPDIVRGVMRNKITEAGYAVGDEVDIGNVIINGSTVQQALWSNATNVGVSSSNIGYLEQKTGGGQVLLTVANWRVVFYCIWL